MQPGYKTVGFWASAAATVLAAFTASGAVGDGSLAAQAAATVGAALVAAGYSSLRAFAKGADGKPAWKSTEFWMTAAAAIVAVMGASGAMASDTMLARVVSGAAGILAALGYGARHAMPPK